MRVTDDRYSRDRLRIELALRLIGHEARTQTIRQWTGLSDDRIRKLFRSYIRPGAGVRRHRGRSPRQVAHFLRGGIGGADAHALASMLLLFGVLPAPSAAARRPGETRAPLPSLNRGRSLCDAFETYRRIVPEARIDFEHAVFLAVALHEGGEIRLQWCAACDAANITEHSTLRAPPCRACGSGLQETAEHAARPATVGAGISGLATTDARDRAVRGETGTLRGH
jgi:hypothetical protein